MHVGASSKTNNEEKAFAGYFGEGFKVASLCAMRDYDLGIKTSSSNWSINAIETEIKIDGNANKFYGIEVKSGKNSGKTITKSLNNGKIKFAIYLKGLTEGGAINKIYTIPIYLFPRFKFEDIKNI